MGTCSQSIRGPVPRDYLKMRISVFGLGYVGCVTASCLAKSGHEVIGVDTNSEKVAMINSAIPPLMEPGLEALLKEVVGAGKLRATNSAVDATRASDICLISVGTPSSRNGQLDVTALKVVGDHIGSALRERKEPYTVIVRSTVLPGTTEEVLVPAILGSAGAAFRRAFAAEPPAQRDRQRRPDPRRTRR